MRNYFNILLQYFLTILLASCCVMNLYCLLNRGTMYAYTKFDSRHVPKEFGFLECLLFGALISATDPGLLVWITQSKEQNFHLYYSAPVNNRLKIQLLFHIHSILAFSLQNAPTPFSGHLIVCISICERGKQHKGNHLSVLCDHQQNLIDLKACFLQS